MAGHYYTVRAPCGPRPCRSAAKVFSIGLFLLSLRGTTTGETNIYPRPGQPSAPPFRCRAGPGTEWSALTSHASSHGGSSCLANNDCAPAINSLESRPPSNIPPFFCMHVSDFLHDTGPATKRLSRFLSTGSPGLAHLPTRPRWTINRYPPIHTETALGDYPPLPQVPPPTRFVFQGCARANCAGPSQGFQLLRCKQPAERVHG
jgi:hypothetical protein